jgi:CMP-N-acetylneuraminic acid synthetase
VRTLGLIPARGGSRRAPGKNLAVLGGKTLVRRALETSLASDAFDVVALSSDDGTILAEADALPGVRQVIRPPELATDTSRAYDAVVHAVDLLESGGEDRFDAVAIVQCTSPFTAPEDLAGAMEMLASTGAESVVSVVPVDAAAHPLKLKRMEGDRLVPFLEDDQMRPSHELPELWVRNGSIYVSRREVLDRGELISEDVLGFRMPRERSHDVDTPLDLALAELLWEKGPS